MSLPWFPFYVDDFQASPKVQRMTMEERGVYVELLCQQHQLGSVEWPCERIASALRGHESSIEYVLSECFEETPDGWVNPRLRAIHNDQREKSAKARKAAKARWDKASDANAERTQSERNANQNQNQNQNQTKSESEARAREGSHPVFGAWNGTTVLALKGLYGWPPDSVEGTDERVWPDGLEWERRRRCLTIACQRLQGEGRAYHGKQFRRTLREVIEEQTKNPNATNPWMEVPLD